MSLKKERRKKSGDKEKWREKKSKKKPFFCKLQKKIGESPFYHQNFIPNSLC